MLQEIMELMGSYQIQTSEIIADGKMHRINGAKKNSAWYVANNLYSSKLGGSYTICTFGDWVTGEKVEFRPQVNLNKKDRAEIDDQIKKQAKKAQIEREREWENVSKISGEAWEYGREGYSSSYIKHKGLSSLYGSRSIVTKEGRGLMVPCRDSDNKIWGIQTIFPCGRKSFFPGQRVYGTYHLVGNVDKADTIYISEGFATAATIHDATAMPSVVAFFANNLKAVAKEVRKKYPKNSIIICADDDYLTDENPGKEKAEEAAEAIASSWIYPKFSERDDDKKLTDFNDLFVEEGLEVVRAQLNGVTPERHFVTYLGHRGPTYYYTSSSNRQIVSISRTEHNQGALTDLMPLEFWGSIYPSKAGADWKSAENDLKKACRAKGFFDERKVRGTGVWVDRGRKLINLGSSIFYNGNIINYEDFESDYIYQIGQNIPIPSKEKLSFEDRKILADLCLKLPWGNEDYGKFLAGYLVIASVCGAFEWRPHIWITGPSGSGKSWVLENLIYPLKQNIGEFFTGKTSEPGIRQTMGADSRPIVFDEFETNDKKSSERVQGVLELIRQASSSQRARVALGSVSGKAISYKVRFCACVGSIRVNLINEADRNRFAVLELKRGQNTDENFKHIKRLAAQIDNEYSEKFFSSNFEMIPIILDNIRILKQFLVPLYGARFADQYGTLMAGYATFSEDPQLTDETAMDLIESFNLQQQSEETDDSDELELLQTILSTIIRYQGAHGIEESTINDLLETKTIYAQRALEHYGIMYDFDHLYISNQNPNLKNKLSNTRWANEWGKSLKRLKGASNNDNKAHRFNGTPQKLSRVPFKK